jgi:copper(I)-binding protein
MKRISQATIRARSRREWFLGVLALAGTAGIGETHGAQQRREHTIEALNAAVDLDRQDASRATVAVTVVNRGSEPDRLDSALSPVAKRVEAHVSAAPPGPFPEIAPATSQDIRLDLIGVNPPLRPGLKFPIVLIFEKAAILRVDVALLEGTRRGLFPPSRTHPS